MWDETSSNIVVRFELNCEFNIDEWKSHMLHVAIYILIYIYIVAVCFHEVIAYKYKEILP